MTIEKVLYSNTKNEAVLNNKQNQKSGNTDSEKLIQETYKNILFLLAFNEQIDLRNVINSLLECHRTLNLNEFMEVYNLVKTKLLELEKIKIVQNLDYYFKQDEEYDSKSNNKQLLKN